MAFTDGVTPAGTVLQTVSLCVQHLSPGQSSSSFPGGSDLNSRHVGRGTKRGTAMQLAIGPLGAPGHQHGAAPGDLPWVAGLSRELSHLAALAPLSASVSAGALCRPGRVKKSGMGAERGVSDPACRLSGSYKHL